MAQALLPVQCCKPILVSVCRAYGAMALTNACPLGVPTPVTLSQPTAVVSEESVPNVSTSHRVEKGLPMMRGQRLACHPEPGRAHARGKRA